MAPDKKIEDFYNSIQDGERQNYICIRREDRAAIARLLFAFQLRDGCLLCQIRGYNCIPGNPINDARNKCNNCSRDKAQCLLSPPEFDGFHGLKKSQQEAIIKRSYKDGYVSTSRMEEAISTHKAYARGPWQFNGEWIAGRNGKIHRRNVKRAPFPAEDGDTDSINNLSNSGSGRSSRVSNYRTSRKKIVKEKHAPTRGKDCMRPLSPPPIASTSRLPTSSPPISPLRHSSETKRAR